MKKDILGSVLCQNHKPPVLLEKLSTTICIQTAVNPTQVYMVTGSDWRCDYKKRAGVNNLDDPAGKSFEEEEEEDRGG